MRSCLLALVLLAGGCSSSALPNDFCGRMAARCGGMHADNWDAWCRSDCVPEEARVPCDANDQCLLCAPAAPGTGSTIERFGLPADDIEFLWTQLLPLGATESIYPPSEVPATGTAFDDGEEGAWVASADGTSVGAWRSLEPVHAELGSPDAFYCEPGPNLYLSSNVFGGDALAMRAVRLPADDSALICPSPFCLSGPYAACDATTPPLCPYGDEPEMYSYGSASQVDRVSGGAEATYGYGRYRASFRASGDHAGPISGTVYAFFSQSNQPCDADGEPNTETNTAEIDVELSASVEGSSGGMPYCDEDEMCFIVSTWTSSHQGLPSGVGGERHQVSGFRFRDRETAGQLRTYGYDWREEDVRFAYDVDPGDCDESAGLCPDALASAAICAHTHFVPRRPSPMHFQLWNSWWGGASPPGTLSEMTVTEVWHRPMVTP